jgi:hypothetical protein
VDQPAEKLSAAQAPEVDHLGGEPAATVRWWQVARWQLLERSVRPMLAVVRRVRLQHRREVAATENQDPVVVIPARRTRRVPSSMKNKT